MKVIRGIQNLEDFKEGSYVTIGIFDGVHLGHQKILKSLKKMAGRHGKTALLTFHPHPVKFFNPGGRFYELSTVDRKIDLVSPFGIDFFVLFPFGEGVADMPPEVFTRKILVGMFRVKGVVVGYDFFFGKGRIGDTKLLKKMGKEFGFDVEVIEPVRFMGSIVSSTRIRELILSGKVREAALFLGRNYRICGTVVRGAGRGRTLGFPTANIDFQSEIIPLPGVYAVVVHMGGEKFRGLTNIGFNPTFGEKTLRVEVHMLDFSGDIYGREISLHFIDRIRDERKFASANDLIGQMKRDVKKGRKILETVDGRGISDTTE
ncbi:MAG: bifunctional riboflavin kinase/FAD synthetase [Deltaproteobacteria bacterium]|nr:bifunctional riboflavin kinase/FAD synthetase [Deltaproteobacteria bacterium]NIS78553.1 bifunctional riboflavin kinase/FAD synthetase [Deltaproteobacteria bacterium]